MLKFVIRRILASLPVLVCVSVAIFAMLRSTAGDPASIIAGEGASEEQLNSIREGLGLAEPLWTQYARWIVRIVQGDFGVSYFYKMSVAELILSRVEPTLLLAVMTISLAILIAVPLGTVAAYKAGKSADRFASALAIVGFSVPVFVIGYLLIDIFSLRLGWTHVQGYQRLSESIGGALLRLVLPALALSTVYIGLITRITRASVMEVMNADYVRTARAKGVDPLSIVSRHVLRNAAPPIVTVIAIGFASLISGVVVTESVFNVPGLGRLMVDAVLARDYPTVQALILIFTAVYILINVVVDISYGIIDPRMRG